MKYLLVLAVVAVAVWVWRGQRRGQAEAPRRPVPPASPPVPTPMVACRHCGTHLPEADAVVGRLGPYCSAEHLRLGEPTGH